MVCLRVSEVFRDSMTIAASILNQCTIIATILELLKW